jgi:glycosyltransferase involved in cell wall biosynthesis
LVDIFVDMKKLRIAQVGTIWERTPPKLYGGTERIVHDLTEELVKQGHDVTLFATGDSKTNAKLQYTYPRAAYRDGVAWENFLYPLDHIANVFRQADQFDIIHVHLNKMQDYAALVLAEHVATPVIFTIHFLIPTKNEKQRKDRMHFLKKYNDRNFISLSNAQRTPDLNFVETVHNGLDFSAFEMPQVAGKYLVWLGRFAPTKGPKEAIEVALKTGMNLIMAGKIDRNDKAFLEYYHSEIAPLIDGKQIKYIGEVNDVQKISLLKKAKVLLNPINWNEPFGLTTIEAMAMGVPVIAFDNGPMKEIIMEGKTGYVVKNTDQMAKAVKKIDVLNRSLISQYAKSHFSASAMAENYMKVYEKIISQAERRTTIPIYTTYGMEKTNTGKSD